MSDKTRVAIYCRVACKDYYALEQQQTILRVFAQEQGYSDITEYFDNGYNGLNFDRPAFVQMERDIQAGLIDMVIIKDISRINRNFIDASSWLERTQRNGVAVKSLNDGDMSILLYDISNVVNEVYREYHNKRK